MMTIWIGSKGGWVGEMFKEENGNETDSVYGVNR